MADHHDLMARVAAHAHDQSPSLPDPVSAEDIAASEQQLGFPLPLLLQHLYREIANGGFGPGYCLLPLAGGTRTAVSAYQDEYRHDDAQEQAHWPRGVLPILDWGCGMYAAVDCLSPDAPVLIFEPNAGPDDWSDAWFQDSPSLAAWLNAWLSGTGWWEEEMMSSGDATEPEPWQDAPQRLHKDASR